MEKRLNLGCGEFPKKGFVNVDIVKSADVVHDLDAFPYPFKKGEFDLIEADHVLEHLENPFRVVKECHRILAPNGKLVVRVPHFSRGFSHPEHKRGFDVSFPLYFDPSFKGGYTGTSFKLEKMELHWFSQLYLKQKVLGKLSFAVGRVFGIAFDFLARLSPYACSRIWCYWVGGFEEIEFVFQKKGKN
ncbi:MAG: methyltransferase domain-containing protein [Candidatus Diapherotrites archaeon]